MKRQLIAAEHRHHELTIEQRRTVVIMRVEAVAECLVRVLIDAGIVQAVGVRYVGVESQALSGSDAIRGEARVVIGTGQAGPIYERTADLRSGCSNWPKRECRLDSLENISHSLCRDIRTLSA